MFYLTIYFWLIQSVPVAKNIPVEGPNKLIWGIAKITQSPLDRRSPIGPDLNTQIPNEIPATTRFSACKCPYKPEDIMNTAKDLTSTQPSTISVLKNLPYLIWLFTESNFPTFVIPNSAFGVLSALSGSFLTTKETPFSHVLLRLPLVVLFNWSNVYIFDLANQRSPESVKEDIVNKPWRPLPTGKISPEQTRRLMLISIPAVLALSYSFGVWQESALILILTWLYNDLKGGDELIRDVIISIAFGIYNCASLKIAIDDNNQITRQGYAWAALISSVILTTMQVQDLKDQAGDRTRGRRTIPLVFGEEFSRWSIAVFIATFVTSDDRWAQKNLLRGDDVGY
ncbi:hypothetical protein FQN57_003593 [Myotisia sp. PD_48]|nr:hypothetical protein FQN57_003593 [Myotisia sp. PD_48]